MTCLPVQRAPWVPAWARQGCRVARASRATLLSRPSLLTHLHTCQASEGLHLPRPVPLPAPAHPAQDRCHLPTCQVGLHSEIGHMIISGLLTCLIGTAMPDYWPVLLKLLVGFCIFLGDYIYLFGEFCLKPSLPFLEMFSKPRWSYMSYIWTRQ